MNCLRILLLAAALAAPCGAAESLDRLYPNTRVGGLSTLECRNGNELFMSGRFDLSFGRVQGGGGAPCRVALNPVGFTIQSDAARLDLFVGAPKTPRRLAYGAGGKAKIVEIGGGAALDGMDEPWLLFFDGVAPCLLCVQRLVKSVRPGDGVGLEFADKVGSAVFVPPFGQFNLAKGSRGIGAPKKPFDPGLFARVLGAKPEAEWKTELPEEVLRYSRGWGARVWKTPVRFSETFEPTPGGAKFTLTFEYEDLGPGLNVPSRPWAVLPPAIALCKAMNGPVETDPEVRVLPWVCAFGPLAVLDGKESVSYTVKVPRLDDYLWDEPPAGEAPDPKFKALRDKLRREIEKILETKELMAPFQHVGCSPKGPAISFHWGNPGETIGVLCQSLPFLEPAKAAELKEYMEKEILARDPLSLSFAGDGARREFIPLVGGQPGPNRAKNLFNVYAVAEYARRANPDAAKERWPKAKEYVESELSGFRWDAGEAPRLTNRLGVRHSELNSRLAGYLGYTRLARMAGDKRAEALGVALFARGLAVLHGQAYDHQFRIERGMVEAHPNLPMSLFVENPNFKAHLLPVFEENGLFYDRGFYGIAWSLPFLVELVPETGRFLRDHAFDPIASAVRYLLWANPGMVYMRGQRPFGGANGENWVIEPYIPYTAFVALATAVREPPEDLCWRISGSRAKFGDLYYIRSLILTLRAFASEKQ